MTLLPVLSIAPTGIARIQPGTSRETCTASVPLGLKSKVGCLAPVAAALGVQIGVLQYESCAEY